MIGDLEVQGTERGLVWGYGVVEDDGEEFGEEG